MVEFNHFVDKQLEPCVEQKIAFLLKSDEMSFADHHTFGPLKEKKCTLGGPTKIPAD